MTQIEENEVVREFLKNAGVRDELVARLSQELLQLLRRRQAVGNSSDHCDFVCEAARRFELEGPRGG
jgi:hypothetical protein